MPANKGKKKANSFLMNWPIVFIGRKLLNEVRTFFQQKIQEKP